MCYLLVLKVVSSLLSLFVEEKHDTISKGKVMKLNSHLTLAEGVVFLLSSVRGVA